MEQGILKLGRGGECKRRPSAHASACWLHDHIRKVTLSQKKTKMSETARAMGRERTTIIVAYIGFRPSWSSNVELILRWDVGVGKVKDIIYKCYRYRAALDTLRFPAYEYDKMASSRRPSRPGHFKTWIIRSHGIKKGQIMSLDRVPTQVLQSLIKSYICFSICKAL